jgi:hypothetical protein
MPKLQETAGNGKADIDFNKTTASCKGSWTLKELGRELKES